MASAAVVRGSHHERTTNVLKRRPFGAIVRDYLIERGIVTPIGNPNWAAFSLEVEGIEYESLRKAVTGERRPSPKIMERVAAALQIDPTIFDEYQLWQVQRSFDPAEVGEDEAFSNLEAWIKSQKRR